MTYLAQTLVFPVSQWVGICQQTWGLHAVLSCGCVISAGWGLLSSLPLLVRAQSMIQIQPHLHFLKQKVMNKLLMQELAVHESWHDTNTSKYIFLLYFFGCKMAYVWITCAHWSEANHYFQLWQEKNVMQSFSACMHHMHLESMQVVSHSLIIVKLPDCRFKKWTKSPDFPTRREGTQVKLPAR